MVAKLCHRIIHLPREAYTVTTVPPLPARLLAPLRRRTKRWRVLFSVLILCLSIFLSVLFDRPARVAAQTCDRLRLATPIARVALLVVAEESTAAIAGAGQKWVAAAIPTPIAL